MTEAVQESLRGERDRNEYSDASGQESSDIYTTTPPPSSWGSLSSVATDGQSGMVGAGRKTWPPLLRQPLAMHKSAKVPL